MVEANTDLVYKQLKKQNGEAVARVIRSAVLLDIPNIVHILEFAGNNPDEVKDLVPVIREIYKEKQLSDFHTDKDPIQLLSEAGYDAFVVKNEEQKNSIKKYYRPGEEICTLRDSRRHLDYYMIHAVKRGANKIKPAEHPQREDEYGRSVISIQIAKTGGFISIKNRYNHTVSDPDNTFNSNPDNIIHGLSNSLKKYFHVDFNTSHTSMPRHFIMVNDQLVRYNYEIDNIYFGSDYYFSGSTINKLNNTNQLLFYKGFILNIAKGNNHIESLAGSDQKFCDELNKIVHDKKINTTVTKDGIRTILLDGNPFISIKNGKITNINTNNYHISRIRFNNEWVDLLGAQDFSGVDELDLQFADLSDVTSIKFNSNAKEIVVANGFSPSGDLDFSGVRILKILKDGINSCSNVKSIKLNSNAQHIEILPPGLKLSGDLDFSGVNFLRLGFSEMDNVKSIKFNPEAALIELEGGTGFKLSGEVDFSHVTTLSLTSADLTSVTKLKLNRDEDTPVRTSASFIHTKFAGELDFDSLDKLYLHDPDLSRVKSIKFNSHASDITISYASLHGELDFSHIYDLSLEDVDLNTTNVKINPYAHSVNLFGSKLYGDFDFSGVRYLDIGGADLTNVKSIKFNPDTDAGRQLSGTKLSGNWDFRNFTNTSIILNGADLTKVTSMKFGNNFVNLGGAKLAGFWDFSDRGGNFELQGVDFTAGVRMKFNSNRTSMNFCHSKFAGNIDFDDMGLGNMDELCLQRADLSRVTNLKCGEKAFVDLWCAVLGGDLDFSEVKYIQLKDADFSHVKSIKLGYKYYKDNKNIYVVIKNNRIPLKNLSKYGIKIIKPNVFEVAKAKVEKLIAEKQAQRIKDETQDR